MQRMRVGYICMRSFSNSTPSRSPLTHLQIMSNNDVDKIRAAKIKQKRCEKNFEKENTRFLIVIMQSVKKNNERNKSHQHVKKKTRAITLK